MRDRWGLIQRGLFPETLPPCFTSYDLKRSFSGLIRELKSKEFHNRRETDYIRYNGTKHDGSRRYFGTPNPISYFYVADFIAEYWDIFERRFVESPFSVSRPKIARDTDDRPIIIPSLSELTTIASKQLGQSAYVLKTDIAQFFPSIYTHAICWSAYGIEQSKIDIKKESEINYFNRLDFFIRNCQNAETRGVLVGPDAFRLVAEFVIAGIDTEFFEKSRDMVVGAARHVDDYFIGLNSQPQALASLSVLRDILQRFHLNINDAKTKTISGVEPLNEVWAQSLRKEARQLKSVWDINREDLILFYDRAITEARSLGSDSPVKIALRTLDQTKIYNSRQWDTMEPYLLRTLHHHPHCIDYIILIVAKRIAIGREIDRNQWAATAFSLISRHLALNHHHEVVWMLWLLLIGKFEIPEELTNELSRNNNAHIRSLIIAGYAHGLLATRPPIALGSRLPTTDNNWLLNLVARTSGYSKAAFSGSLASEFEHLAKKRVRFIDFDAHMTNLRRANIQAISRSRYGYDDDDDHDDDDQDYDGNAPF